MFTSTLTSSINHADIQFGKELGRGGFGVVYHGIWRHNDVAIKQLLIDKVSPESALEFQTESQVMAGLHSPNIVQFYGFCMTPHYCIVMEYMPNGSLFSVLHSDKAIEWTLRFNIALDVAKGLSFLHHENILHRDIKSLNVLLDKTYQAKLTDFGLSKVKAETKSNTMASKTSKDSVGTIAWMAPELFKRKAIYTSKSDIYSLGFTYWEMASRKIPFADAISPDLISGWVKDGEREDMPSDCPEAFAKLIEQCWVGEADSRPSADTVVERLKVLTASFVDTTISTTTTATSTVTTTLSSGPVYRDNLDSTAVPKPLVFSETTRPLPPIPVVVKPAAQVVPVMQTPVVDAKDVSTYLKYVVEGEQEKAAAMLQKNKDLALVSGNVTDLSKRTFTNITGFQYAVWALDWHMWKMIRQYLPDEEAAKQIQAMETGAWVSQYGKSASWQNLIDALQKVIDLCKREKWDEATTQWQKNVGGAQRLLPVHVVNEYCHYYFDPSVSFYDNRDLPRSRKIYDGEWFTATENDGKLGETFAYYRCLYNEPFPDATPFPTGRTKNDPLMLGDLKACQDLLVTRTYHRDQMFNELASKNVKVSIKQ